MSQPLIDLESVESARGPQPALGQPRGVKTREKLLSAAWDLFATRGFEGTSIGDVARRAEVGVGTVYHHFRDKRAILLELLEYENSALITNTKTGGGGLSLALASDDFSAASQAVLRMAADVRRRRPSLLLIARDVGRRDPEVAAVCARIDASRVESMRDDIALGQRLGKLRADVDLDQASKMVQTIIDVGLTKIAEAPETAVDEQIEILADLLNSYLLAP